VHTQHTTRLPKKWDDWRYVYMEWLSTLNTFQKLKIKKIKKVLDVLFKAYPIVPLSCRSTVIWPDGTFKLLL
jgi:hypothetical protein